MTYGKPLKPPPWSYSHYDAIGGDGPVTLLGPSQGLPYLCGADDADAFEVILPLRGLPGRGAHAPAALIRLVGVICGWVHFLGQR